MDVTSSGGHDSFMRCVLAFITSAFLASTATADGVDVDLELVLMVDVSRSMTERELDIQRRGYAEALQSADVFAAVQAGLLQRIALSYVEWAGTQEVIVQWRLLETREDLLAFAEAISPNFHPGLRRTSISEALVFAQNHIADNDYEGLRKVVDISGDGPNNQGRPVTRARDLALADGLIINGLPLMTQEGLGSQWHLERLDLYYQNCVIGGPGAFVIPVYDWEDFAEAVRRKLVLEIAGDLPEATIVPVQFTPVDPLDCRAGEKMLEQRRMNWGSQ